ncbi:hypothetical protein FNH22_05925 [Fulvivirga sp. M361]|uniref:hypothetical protein n=1 Tax=Fulvivirga sp. M361 TaxID=2594266 RepID=UPI00117A30A3|nr:hypothetical protein [Fulvivirga sp. M361]TRX60587.1 hypothetical protein FNH22_05925 [Fulvivirga sp. M361]
MKERISIKNYNFKKRNLFSGPHLLGLILIAAGLFALISPTILESDSSFEKILLVGTGAIAIGLVIVSSYHGILIDFAGNRSKEYFSLCGYKFGEWVELPKIIKVKLKSVQYKATNTPNGISPTLSGNITDHRVLLYADKPTPVHSFIYAKEERAFQEANYLASGFNTVFEGNQ